MWKIEPREKLVVWETYINFIYIFASLQKDIDSSQLREHVYSNTEQCSFAIVFNALFKQSSVRLWRISLVKGDILHDTNKLHLKVSVNAGTVVNKQVCQDIQGIIETSSINQPAWTTTLSRLREFDVFIPNYIPFWKKKQPKKHDRRRRHLEADR